MRTGERRLACAQTRRWRGGHDSATRRDNLIYALGLAARAWVGAASSARANAHRAAAILKAVNKSLRRRRCNSDAQRCELQPRLQLFMFLGLGKTHLDCLAVSVVGLNAAHKSLVHQQSIAGTPHSYRVEAPATACHVGHPTLHTATRQATRAQPWQGGHSPSGPPSPASGPSRPSSSDKRSGIKQPSRMKKLLRGSKLYMI